VCVCVFWVPSAAAGVTRGALNRPFLARPLAARTSPGEMSYCNFNVSAVSIYDLGYWQWLAGPILYFVVFVFGLSQLIIHLCSSADNIRHYIIMLTMFLTSLLLRGLWFLFTCPTQQASPSTNSSLSSLLMLGDPDPYSSFGSMLGSPETFTVYQAGIKVMSKISLLLYFTAFTMYVYLWAKVMPFIKVKTLTLAFVVVNVLLWIVVAVLETVAILESSGTLPPPNGTKVDLQCGNAIYNSIICLLAVMQLLIAALFCGYGFQFMRVLRKAAVSSRRDTQSRKKVRLSCAVMHDAPRLPPNPNFACP